ncbi:LuxR family transcriptional regulator [Lapillicoccus sp.]|uniref:LuxR family transcriptional regulator n=1 Tax=Lapillicoccus sp. TaxID=1909287 RepID=UPI0025D75833|nr:LuxR family transcriptional regulator [Lapillicoccus sp.]
MTEHTNTRPIGSEVEQLPRLAAELLEQARDHPAQRAARTIHSGSLLRATVIALVSGTELAEHDAPPAATLQVVQGQVRLYWEHGERVLDQGEITDIPPARHALQARTDAVVLLTVALQAGPAEEATARP